MDSSSVPEALQASDHDAAIQTETAENITFMEAELYRHAERGQISAFRRNNELQLEQLLTPNKNTVLHIYITASTTGETKFVEEILEICPSLLMQPNTFGEIPLHLAARYGHARIVELLISRARSANSLSEGDLESGTTAASDNAAADMEMLRKTTELEKDTALHEAVRFHHLSVVRILTKADTDFLHPANKAHETPFYLAAERGYLDLVQEMLANCSSLKASGPNKRTALHAAVLSKNRVLIRKILKNMPHLTEEADDKGCVPLHYAAESKFSLVIVRMLLRRNKSAAYRRDIEGRTPLHIATSCGRIRTMKEILQACPDSSELVDNRGWNILHFAVQGSKRLPIKFILKKSSLSNLLNQKDNEGNTPLHIIASSNLGALLSHFRIDMMAFNKQNYNAFDIVSNPNKRVWQTTCNLWHLRRRGLRRGYRIQIRKEDGKEEDKLVVENNETSSKTDSVKEPVLIVAALIATVTFTAGFTLPGGYVSDKGPLQGTAVLRKKTAFQAFVITDMIALTLSSCAVIFHLAFTLRKRQSSTYNLDRSLALVGWAMTTMVIAFITGVWAVLEPSLGLLTVIFMISLLFFRHSYSMNILIHKRLHRVGKLF